MRKPVCCLVCLCVFLSLSLQLNAADKGKTPVYPLAVISFNERGREVAEMGSKVTDLMFANLIVEPKLYLVDRADLDKLLKEQELNLSGMVNPAQATQVGKLTGAKIIVTGSVLQVGDKLIVVAKIIGTETSRVLGASVKGSIDDDLDTLVEKLADEVTKTITKRAGDLVAKTVSRKDKIAALKKTLRGKKLPSVMIDIKEAHIGQRTIDPAVETEVTLFATESGFKAIDPDKGRKTDADVLIVGEAFSEFAGRRGNLISVKARVEVKAIDRTTGKVIAIDRQTTVTVDVTELVAGKTALQEAGAIIAERMLPKLAKAASKKK
jgi:TolB-like protein